MIVSIVASFIIMSAFVGAFAIISLIRAKFMGASAPHSCAEGCASCKNHCENYNAEELTAKIRESMKSAK